MSAERKSPVKKTLLGGAAVLVLLIVVLLVRALTVSSAQVPAEPTKWKALPGAAERLSESVKFKTTSNSDVAKMDLAEFQRFNQFLVDKFPKANEVMRRELVPPCSVVYRWLGTDAKAQPVLFASHTDVVPVEEDQIDKWTHDPYSGAIADGFIWGRGTLDDKVGVLGLLEGVEALATAGHKPKRTIVFAFGCDEEVGGEVGAKRIAKYFFDAKDSFEFVLDEGLAIVRGYVPGTPNPVALIGIVEKGFGTYTLRVESEGGHSSMPPPQSAIGVLSEGISKLEKNQMPARLNPASRLMFETLAPDVDFGFRLLFSNLWLLEPVLVKVLEGKPQTNASVRTTTAVTIMRAGVQDNVLPKRAVAKVNFRLIPGDSLEDVHDHIIEAVNDVRIEVEMPEKKGFANPASRISSPETPAFEAISTSIRAAIGTDVLVVPSATTGGTDARHYESVTGEQYRFAPLLLEKKTEDTARIHGTDERISVEGYEKAIAFYADLLARF